MFANDFKKHKFSLRKKSIGLVPVILGAVLVSGVSTANADEVSNTSTPNTTISDTNNNNSQEVTNLNNELESVNKETTTISNDIASIDNDISKVNNDISSNSSTNTNVDDIQNQLNALNTQIDESNKANSERTELENTINSTKSEIATTEATIQEDEAKANTPETFTITKDPAGDAYREQQANIQSKGGEGRTALLGFSNSETKVYDVNLTKEQADEYKRTGTIIYKPNLEKYIDASVTLIKNIRLVNGIPLEVPPVTAQANDFAHRRAEELSDTDFRYAHDSKRYPEEAEKNRGAENIGEVAPGLTKGMSGFNEMPFSDEELAYKNAYEYLAEYSNAEGADFSHAYNLLDMTSIDGIGYGLVTKVKDGRLSIVNTFDGYSNTPGKNLLSREVYENQVKPVDDNLKEVKLPDGTVQLQYKGNPIKFVPHILFKYHYTGDPDPEVAKRLESERSKLAELKTKLSNAESKVASLSSNPDVSELTAKRDDLNKKLEELKSNKVNTDELTKKLNSLNSDKDSKAKRLAELNSKKADILKKLDELRKTNNTANTKPEDKPTLTNTANEDSINKLTNELNEVNNQLSTKNSSITTLDNKISELTSSLQNRGIQTETAKKDLESKIDAKSSELATLKDELEKVQSSTSTETKEVVRDLAGVSTQDRDYAHEQGKKITGKIYFADSQVEDVTIKITPEQGKQLLEHGYFEPTFDDREYAEKMGYWMNEIRKANGIDLKVPPVTEQAMAYAKSRTESMAQTGDFNHPKNPDSKYVYENISFDRITERDGIYKGANGFALSTDELAYVDSFEYMSEYSNIEEESDFGHARNELVLSAVNGIGAAITAHKEGNKTLYYRSLNGTNLNSLEDYRHEYRYNVVPIQDRIREVRDSEGSKILTYNGVPIKFPRKRVYHYVWDEPVDNSSKVNELSSKIASVQGELDSLNADKSKLDSANTNDLQTELDKATKEKEDLHNCIVDLTSKRAELESKIATLKADETPKAEDTPKADDTSKADDNSKVETPKADDNSKVETPKVDDTSKVETPKADNSSKVETPKADESNKQVDTPKADETPKLDEIVHKDVDTPKLDEVVHKSDDNTNTDNEFVLPNDAPTVNEKPNGVSKDETSKVEVPKADNTPKVEVPKSDESTKVEVPKADNTPKVETPKVETPKVDVPKSEDTPKVEIPKVEVPKSDDTPKVETPKVEVPKSDEKPKVDEQNGKKETSKSDTITGSKEISKVGTDKKDSTQNSTNIISDNGKGVTTLDKVTSEGKKLTDNSDLPKEKLQHVTNSSVMSSQYSSKGKLSGVSNTSSSQVSNQLPNTGDSNSKVLEAVGLLSLGLALAGSKLVNRKRDY